MARKPAMRSRGFSAQRSSASTSLTWAASRNLSPPYFTKGILRRVSSSSRRALCAEARNSTACCLSLSPSSRRASTLSTTKSACAASSFTVTKRGRCAEARSLHRFLAKRSAASAITALAASRMGWVER